MANKLEIDDEIISSLVQSVQYRVPAHVEEEVNAAMMKTREEKSRWARRPLMWYPVSMAAATALILALLIFQPFMEKKAAEPVKPISEIKTVFELKDKNIKILWVQKKDFSLRINE